VWKNISGEIMRTLQIILLLILAFGLIGCTDDKPKVEATPYYEYQGDIQFDNNGIALMECSRFVPKAGSLGGYIKTFKNNGVYDANLVDVKLTSDLDLNGRILSFYRWKQESSNGAIVGDTRPLTFDVNINGRIFTGFTQLTSTASGTATTNQMTFTVHGTDLGYQALQVAVYNAATGVMEFYSDALIPFFYAHPTDYKNTHQRQTQLQNLHPYISELNSAEADEVFARRSYNDFCF
jgi:hypothetical protein